jgi:hypothetical protein
MRGLFHRAEATGLHDGCMLRDNRLANQRGNFAPAVLSPE